MNLIDFAVINDQRTHYVDHMAPVYHALPDEYRGVFWCSEGLAGHVRAKGIEPAVYPNRRGVQKAMMAMKHKPLTVVCGHMEPSWLDYSQRPNTILMHGVGFCFDAKRSHPSYPGTTMHRRYTRLMLATNEHIADIERTANPQIRVDVVGCPKLDRWHIGKKRRTGKKPTVALAWHWRCGVSRDTGTAWDEYKAILPALKEHYNLLGHGHPAIIDELIPQYEAMGIPWTRSLDEVFDRADLMVADATSAIFEFASLDRPVVPVMSSRYRNEDHGGMLKYRTELGPVCESPVALIDTIARASQDAQEAQQKRRDAIQQCYAYTDGKCAERAALALIETADDPQTYLPRQRIQSEPMNPRRRHVGTYRERVCGPSYAEKVFGGQQQPNQPKPAAKKPNSDDFLRSMGWLIPKKDVKLQDPGQWPSVAIIIPVYNAPELLKRCLDSLMMTDYPGDLTTIKVDNASTDLSTGAMLCGGNQDNVIRFDTPVGFSEAVNAGMKATPDAAYHILFNQDVQVIDPDWLKRLIRWMEHKPECAVCGPKLLYDNQKIENAGIDMGPGDGCAERGRGSWKDHPAYNEYRKVATVSGAVYCIRASVEKQLGLFDQRYLFGCEDLMYGMKASAKLGLECWYVPDSVLIHSSHAVQRSVTKEDRERVKAMHAVSSEVYNREWGTFCEHLGNGTRVAFVLPNFHSACGGARVVGALARQLSICGVQAEVFAKQMDTDPDKNYPKFPIRPFSELKETDIIVATRCDTVWDCVKIPAKKRYYLVQQIEDCMSQNFSVSKQKALASYKQNDFEIITIGTHLADRLKEMGRDSHILDVGLYRNLYPYIERKPSKTPRVLMYGADGYKGPDQPAIAEAIRKAVPGAVVNCYHRYAKECKWADTHHRPQTTAEVAELYASHDIYVYASESDGFAMTPVEAMACGTAVVLSDFPGKDQYAVDGVNCLVAGFRDVDGIAERVKKIAGDKRLWACLVKAGTETVDRYDWGVLTAQYARVMLGAPV
jgi:GT2 family glycosyltransferase/glycosyltransferase involved in cell wall biosynthesis